MNNPSIASAAFSAAESVASQPRLFDSDLIPLDVGIGQAAAQLTHSGAITTRNEAKAMAIAACKLAGLSDKATAAKVGCSRNTIGPVMEHLERSGRIPALQARLAYSLGRVAESSANELQRIVDNGEWTMESAGAVRALAVATGIATEKLQLVTGQATAILEQRITSAGADQVREWEGKLRQAFGIAAPTLDVQSEVHPPKLLIERTAAPLATESATEPAPAAVPVPVTGARAVGTRGGGPPPPPPRSGTMPPSK